MAYAESESDVLLGEKIYVKCMACHALAYHRTGPKHCGVVGRYAGEVDGFEFTSAMKKSAIKWTPATLDEFLQAPLDMVPGTSMGYAGISSAKERHQLIAFLLTLTNENPLCR